MTAASSPTRGPTTTRGSFTAWRSRIACSVPAGSFPTGRNDICAASISGEQLEQIRREVEELRAAARAADVTAETLAQPGVDGLADERLDPPLRLGADARVRQTGRDRLRALDPAARGVDLVGEVEAVDVVVHRVEEMQAAVDALDAHDLAPDEHALLARPRTVEVGLHRRDDRARGEQRVARGAVREARVRQIDP